MKFAPWVLLTLAALLSVTYGQAVSDNGVTTEGISSSTAGTISLTAIGGSKSRRVVTSSAFLMVINILQSTSSQTLMLQAVH